MYFLVFWESLIAILVDTKRFTFNHNIKTFLKMETQQNFLVKLLAIHFVKRQYLRGFNIIEQ